MTNSHRNRIAGHRASLTQRGVLLQFPDGNRAVGLVEIVTPEPGERVLGEASRNAVRVHVLRSLRMSAAVGESIRNTESGVSYRVVDPDVTADNPISVWLCEAS